MTEDKIMDKLKAAFKIAVPNVDVDSLHPDTQLSTDLNLDSVDLVSLVIAIEEEFDISIPEEKFQDITTVQQALDVVSEHAVVTC